MQSLLCLTWSFTCFFNTRTRAASSYRVHRAQFTELTINETRLHGPLNGKTQRHARHILFILFSTCFSFIDHATFYVAASDVSMQAAGLAAAGGGRGGGGRGFGTRARACAGPGPDGGADAGGGGSCAGSDCARTWAAARAGAVACGGGRG